MKPGHTNLGVFHAQILALHGCASPSSCSGNRESLKDFFGVPLISCLLSVHQHLMVNIVIHSYTEMTIGHCVTFLNERDAHSRMCAHIWTHIHTHGNNTVE